MPEVQHCRHCWGACPGDCIVGDYGACIHGWNGKRPRRFYWQLVMDRGWWRRVLGIRGGREYESILK